MPATRRTLLKGLGSLPLMALGTTARAAVPVLPDRAGFGFSGVFLDAAYVHPLGQAGYGGAERFLASRRSDVTRRWPGANPRNAAVAAFAGLINADPAEIAVVPGTMAGENLLLAALGIGPGAGVVTDALHYDASLAMYGEWQRRGVPVALVAPRGNRIDVDDVARQIGPGTKLVAVSLVASVTGFEHDLKQLCEAAHARGALVYADIIQAAGAVPVDVRASGVDFCCCGTYKWLMGEFGVGFMYVRADRLQQLRRLQFGWRSLKAYHFHAFPFDAPGPPIGDWELRDDTASYFESGTPDWAALAAVTASIGYPDPHLAVGLQRHGRYRALAAGVERPGWRDHPLTGDWPGHRGCHIGGRFLQIYRPDDSGKHGIVVFIRSDTQSWFMKHCAARYARHGHRRRCA
jgi:selenocysteine lyase/cysteine desulfurase